MSVSFRLVHMMANRIPKLRNYLPLVYETGLVALQQRHYPYFGQFC